MSRALGPGGASVLSCPICNEPTDPAQPDYCSMHTRAFDNLRQAFRAWNTAYGSLSAPEFLKRLKRLPGTGKKVREVAQFLHENPARWE